jgi:hypothetical protein
MKNKRDKVLWSVGAAAVGAGLMALLDPQSGKRRRAVIRDRSARAARKLGESAGRTWRDLTNRGTGAVAKVQRLGKEEEVVADDVLQERVRAKVGRLVSNPSSIEVTSQNGLVTLTGPVLAEETDRLLRGVRSVRGVSSVENQLDIHVQADQVPGLQGASETPAGPGDRPATRSRRRSRPDAGDGVDRNA